MVYLVNSVNLKKLAFVENCVNFYLNKLYLFNKSFSKNVVCMNIKKELRRINCAAFCVQYL